MERSRAKVHMYSRKQSRNFRVVSLRGSLLKVIGIWLLEASFKAVMKIVNLEASVNGN